MNTICVFCLSKNRKLFSFNDKHWQCITGFLNVEFEANIQYLHTKNLLRVCWECRAKINNISSFIKCAQETCSSLTLHVREADESLPKSVSKLCRTQVKIIDVLSFEEESSVFESKISTKYDTKFLVNNTSISNVKLESDWIKIDGSVGSNHDVIAIDSGSDSDNEPLVNRINIKCKKKTETKKLLLKPPVKLKKPSPGHTAKCTVSWASNSQAETWYMEERRVEREANPTYHYKCDACQRTFSEEEALNMHVKRSHSEEAGQFTCNLCLYRFIDETTMKQHIENHYIQYKCNECCYVTRTLALMNIHTKDKHSKEENAKDNVKRKTVMCKRCKNHIPSGEEMKKHRKDCQLYKCDECEKTFSNSSSYRKHKNGHKNPTLNAYTYCEGCKSYIKNTWYKKHFLTSLKHVSRDDFKYPCTICSIKMPTSYTLKLHMYKVHLKRGSYECDLCPAYFMNRRVMERHRASKHLGTWEMKRDKICELCGKGFTSNHLLNNHRRTHTGEKPHGCQYCPAKFAQQGSLYRHNVGVHQKRIAKTGSADVDKVCCDACGKEFATKSLLKIHYDYYHLKKTKHRCEICDKYFISTVTLRSHNEHRHSLVTNKTHPCTSCDKVFKTTQSLKQHLKTKCTENQYKCRTCNDTFRRSSNLNMHYKMKHLKLKRNDRVAIKNLNNLDKEIVVIRDPVKL